MERFYNIQGLNIDLSKVVAVTDVIPHSFDGTWNVIRFEIHCAGLSESIKVNQGSPCTYRYDIKPEFARDHEGFVKAWKEYICFHGVDGNTGLS